MQEDKRVSLDDYANMGSVSRLQKTDLSKYRNLDSYFDGSNAAPSQRKTAASGTASGTAAKKTAASADKSKAASQTKNRKSTAPARNEDANSRTPKGKDTRGEKKTSKKKRPPVDSRAEKKKSQTSQKSEKILKKNGDSLKTSNENTVRKRGEGYSHVEIMKERSDNVNKKRRFGLAATAVILVLIGIFVAIFNVLRSVKVEKILIEGESIYSDEKIIKKSTVAVDQRIFDFKKDEVAEKLVRELPYIGSVEVRRDYSDGNAVILTVTDTSDMLVVKNGKNWFCVDENDKVLSLKKKKLREGMFRVEGLKSQQVETGTVFVPSEENLEGYQAAKKIAKALLLSGNFENSVINVSKTDDLVAVYDSRVALYFGASVKELSESELAEKLRVAYLAVQQEIGDTDQGYALIGYSERVVVLKGTMEK